MSDDLDVPKVGKVPKKVLIPLVIGLAGFVAWRFYVYKTDGGTTADPAAASDFADGGTPPGVVGAVSPTNSYGADTGATGDVTPSNSMPKSNAEWSQQVAELLQQSDRWSYADIVTALGNYLGSKGLTTVQQDIVRSAIALKGYPPSGSYSIIPLVSGGSTPIIVAPSGVTVTTTDTTATVSFSPVAGATSYRLYRDGVGTNIGTSGSSPITVGGLTPNTNYTFKVAAFPPSGNSGPFSAKVSGKTKAVTLAKPATPTVSGIAKTTATVKTSAVPHAQGYDWYVNGVSHGHSDGTTYGLSGLHAGTKYTVAVAADTTTQGPGPRSLTRTFTTKK